MSIWCIGKPVHIAFHGELYTEDILGDGCIADIDCNSGNPFSPQLLWTALSLWGSTGTVWQYGQKSVQKAFCYPNAH
jgi:hypothetical protein